MTSRKIPESAVENLVSDLEGKVDKTSTQTISGSKRFTQPPEGMSIELVADTNQQTVPTAGTLRQLALYKNNTHTKGDGYTSWLQAVRGNDGWTSTELYARRFLESDSQEIVNYFRVGVSPDGIPVSYTKTPPVGVTGEEIVTAGWVRNLLTPTGTIIIWSAPNPPAGYLVCNGAAISRTTYAALFKVIGTTWGSGDGNTTFNVPNFVDRYPVGVGSLGAVGTLLNQGLPNITGQFQVVAGASVDNPSGCFYFDTNSPITYSRTGGDYGTTYPTAISASRSSNVYGAATRVQPFSSIVNFCIRY